MGLVASQIINGQTAAGCSKRGPMTHSRITALGTASSKVRSGPAYCDAVRRLRKSNLSDVQIEEMRGMTTTEAYDRVNQAAAGTAEAVMADVKRRVGARHVVKEDPPTSGSRRRRSRTVRAPSTPR